MALNSKVIGKRTRLQDMVSTTGKTVESTRAIGTKIICTDKVYTSGRMVDSMKDPMWTTRKRDMECINTQTAVATRANGRMASNTARAHSSVQRESPERASGKMARDSTG